MKGVKSASRFQLPIELYMPLAGWLMWVGQLFLVVSGIGLVYFTSKMMEWELSWRGLNFIQPGFMSLPILCGLGWFAWGWSWSRRAAREWSRGVATIVKSYSRFHHLTIDFVFEVHGTTYISDRVNFGWIMHDQHNNWIDANPVGRKVWVYYDPANPTRNCLQMIGLQFDQMLLIHLFAFVAVEVPLGLYLATLGT